MKTMSIGKTIRAGAMAVFFLIVSAVLFAQTGSVEDLDRETARVAEQIKQYFRGDENRVVTADIKNLEFAGFGSMGVETPLGLYWRRNLEGLLAGTPGLVVHTSPSAERSGYVLSGELLDLGSLVRVFTRLTLKNDSTLLAVWSSDLEKTPFVENLLIPPSTSGGRAVFRDTSEEDSRNSPIEVILGGNPLGRTIHQNDNDWFLVRPESSMFAVFETTGSMDTVMELYDENGNTLAENDDGGNGGNAKIEYFLEAGKSYIVMVRGYSSETGHYQFSARGIELPDRTLEPNNTRETASPIVLGREINAVLVPGEEDWYSFTAATNGQVRIIAGGSFERHIVLYNAEGCEIASSGESGQRGELSSFLSSGRYFTLVRGASGTAGGTYVLRTRFRENAAPDSYERDDTREGAKEIKTGETQRHNFTDGSDIDWVYFDIASAGMYRIRSRGESDEDLDTEITLYGEDNESIADDDDGGPGYSSLLRRRLNPGRYYLRVHCLDEEPEDHYLLSIEQE